MNMKPVEMQIAVPRTTDASAIQQQMQQRPTTEQFMLNEQAIKHMQAQRQRSEKVDASADGRIRDRESDSNQEHNATSQDHEQNDQKEGKETVQPAVHPYKGKHIDFSV